MNTTAQKIAEEKIATQKTVTLNGSLTTTDSDNVLTLLTNNDMAVGRFAVEIDGMIVPKSRLAATAITDGMIIEVVQAVGGG